MTTIQKTSLLVLALVLSSCANLSGLGQLGDQPQVTDQQSFDPFNPLEVSFDDYSLFNSGLTETERDQLDFSGDKSFYLLDVKISDDLTVLEGKMKVRYTNTEEVPLEEIFLLLYANLMGEGASVSNLQVDGVPSSYVSEFFESVLRIDLSSALQPGDSTILEMDFETVIPQEKSGNYGLFGHFDEMVVLQEFFPLIPVYDDEGWDIDRPPPHGDLTYLDASYFIVRVQAPQDLKLITSGVTLGRATDDGVQSETFAIGPARDVYIAASENFDVVSAKVGSTTVNSYAFPHLDEGSKFALDVTLNALESFNNRFGPYPYSELDVVATSMDALGMEYPGVIAVSDVLYDLDARPYGIPSRMILESTLAHEVAHQWFYNTVANDQVDEPWMDEAIVQYVTGLYYLDQYGEGGMEGYRQSWRDRWQRVENAPIPIGLPSGDYDGSSYGAIVYGRGPLFVDELAGIMGSEVFDDFLRAYYTQNKWGIGTGEAFRQLAEEFCQCDLSGPFEEWVYE